MSEFFFPMFVKISDQNVFVIGGGQIAARRVATLLRFTKRITLVSKECSLEMQKLLEMNPEICYISRKLDVNDLENGGYESLLEGADMVLTATNQRDLNASIVHWCKENGILVNTADDKTLCDFYFPSVVEKDGVLIALNSGGESPSRVKRLRKRIEGM